MRLRSGSEWWVLKKKLVEQAEVILVIVPCKFILSEPKGTLVLHILMEQ
jgi:hypothetical protein